VTGSDPQARRRGIDDGPYGSAAWRSLLVQATPTPAARGAASTRPRQRDPRRLPPLRDAHPARPGTNGEPQGRRLPALSPVRAALPRPPQTTSTVQPQTLTWPPSTPLPLQSQPRDGNGCCVAGRRTTQPVLTGRPRGVPEVDHVTQPGRIRGSVHRGWRSSLPEGGGLAQIVMGEDAHPAGRRRRSRDPPCDGPRPGTRASSPAPVVGNSIVKHYGRLLAPHGSGCGVQVRRMAWGVVRSSTRQPAWWGSVMRSPWMWRPPMAWAAPSARPRWSWQMVAGSSAAASANGQA
jgi:hypothetical protein